MERLEQVGPNEIVKQKQISFFKLAKEEPTEPLILLLFAVGFFYAIWGDDGDALTIFAVITNVIFVEVWNKYRAKKTISSLSKMAAPEARVLREGKITEVKSEEVVPEDILVLIPGTRIAADNFLVKLYQPISNKIMDLWALAVSTFLLIAIVIPTLGVHLKISSLTINQLSIILGICLLFIAWQEVWKILFFKEASTNNISQIQKI